ncbi:type II toxin-antitoxin system VapB family antitoxin [Phormidium sp. FACHB-1136]|uniref:antitoxin n=1 Tax=Phormidium sp. FACHB-1136 TaxID=2692848 RepID=UPI001682B8AA|nr:type II toxin-antitoxin system VapB family antitoxin [Phormidium sp. FACHB-1136]MBD2426106.1 AbrB/MazE/SpoVT family DNA-binding domain-containing protein [Phormidium sp. FACHB-1136]
METTPLLTNDNGQVVVLPAAFHLNGTEVYIKKVGNAIVLLSTDQPWQPLFDSLSHFTDDFMSTREQPPLEDREPLFE